MKKYLILFFAIICLTCSCSNGNATIIPGEINAKEKTYESEYLEIACTLPNNWLMYAQSLVAKNNGINKEKMEGADVESMLADENVGLCYDMLARSNDSYNSIDIIYQEYPYDSVGYGESAFAQSMAEEIPKSLVNYGITDSTAKVEEVTFAGRKCYTVKIIGTSNNNKIYEQQVYIIKDNYMAIITFKSWQKDCLSEMMKYFRKV